MRTPRAQKIRLWIAGGCQAFGILIMMGVPTRRYPRGAQDIRDPPGRPGHEGLVAHVPSGSLLI